MQDPQAHLKTYLEDHLAGSVGGIELAKRCLESNRNTPLEAFLTRLLQELHDEQVQLKKLVEACGATGSLIKEAGAWILEKIGRLKLNNQILEYSNLSRLLELEALLAGVNVKLDMWRVLESLRQENPALDSIDLPGLKSQGEAQVAQLVGACLAAGRQAFTNS